MAGWQAQLVFQGDRLIGESLEQTGLDTIQFSDDPAAVPNGERYTLVVVSGYALYGEPRGYYSMGVAHMLVAHQRGIGYMSEQSGAHTEPVSSLSPKQKQAVREWLLAFNPSAWLTSTEAFRQSFAS
jgi:hypothetical protein